MLRVVRFSLTAMLFAIVALGCAPAENADQKHEMTATPYGVWFGTGAAEGWHLSVDAGGAVELIRNGNHSSGSFTFDEKSGSMEVDLGGGKQTWKIKRDLLNLEVAFPDSPNPVTFTMQ